MRVSLRAVLVGIFFLTCSACNEQETVTVHSITFHGVTAVDTDRLKAALATKENAAVPIVGWHLPWGKKNSFDRGRFDQDLKRIEAFYADRGFPEAKVVGIDVRPNKKRDAVDVTLSVSEGEPVRVAAIQFVGFDVIPPGHFKTLQDHIPLKIGQPRDRQLVLTAHEMALNELRDHGYPYATVTTDENDGPKGKEATVAFTAEPGILAHFGTIEIAGNKSVNDGVIQRELTFKPGDLYRRSVVQNSQRRLYGMELFQFVNVETLNAEEKPPDVPTRVTVAEGKHQRLNFGVGYGTEEKARVDAEYHHVNFLGDARSAGTHVRWSSLDRGVRLDFTQPYFFAPHFLLGAEVQRWYTFTPAYSTVASGGKLTVTHRADPQTSWSLSVIDQQETSTIASDARDNLSLRNDLIALGLDPERLEQSGTLSALGVDFQRTTADSALNAHKGYQLAIHGEDAGKLLPGTFHYYGVSADVRHYLPFGPRLVLADRLQVGNIAATGNDQTNVPFSKKYFLGGAATIRGWGRYEVSPLGTSGLPIGGDSLFAFSSELRAILHGSLGAVLFLDTGNVWADSWGFKLNDLRYAVGSGLRYQTPVGPIRLDVGYQLNPIHGLLVDGEPQRRRYRVHFSIGQAF
jgi:outer membrane protein insertion porin family/translocation and assembly module TamA